MDANKAKKGNLFKFVRKRFSSGPSEDAEPINAEEVQLRKPRPKELPASLRLKSVSMGPNGHKEAPRKRTSLGAIQELIQCPLCMEVLVNPKMLPCQHTFCLVCLYTQIQDDNLKCPMCTKIYPDISADYLTSLPSNLYIDNLLKALSTPAPESKVKFVFPPAMDEKRCHQCKSIISMNKENFCQHCKQTFCFLCWEAHIGELKKQIGSLVDQLKAGSQRLNHRYESYKDRNDWLVNQITTNVENKIFEINEQKDKLLKEAADILKKGEKSAKDLQNELKLMEKMVLECVSRDFETSNDNEKVNKFMQFHKRAIDLMGDVGHWGETKYCFDSDKFCIEVDFQQPTDADTDEQPIVEVKGVQNPLENPDSMILYYRSRNFIPRMNWKKCPRPAGIGIPPWSDNIYVCSTDSHHVIVMDRNKGKIVERYSDIKMLCPQDIAFSEKRSEIYVSDKWAHCVHVLSKTGIYLRTIGFKGNKEGCLRSPEGIAVGPNENYLYVCDTGNDRVQVFDLNTGEFYKFIGVYNRSSNTKGLQITQLMEPTAIATTSDRIIIADSGNKRIKIYSYSGEKQKEFGSGGHLKGQFNHPEALALDPLGFILVGDSGNARVQIFDPSGILIRVFGGKGREPGKFGWVSGICITPQLDIIICDTKNHQINIF